MRRCASLMKVSSSSICLVSSSRWWKRASISSGSESELARLKALTLASAFVSSPRSSASFWVMMSRAVHLTGADLEVSLDVQLGEPVGRLGGDLRIAPANGDGERVVALRVHLGVRAEGRHGVVHALLPIPRVELQLLDRRGHQRAGVDAFAHRLDLRLEVERVDHRDHQVGVRRERLHHHQGARPVLVGDARDHQRSHHQHAPRHQRQRLPAAPHRGQQLVDRVGPIHRFPSPSIRGRGRENRHSNRAFSQVRRS